MQCFVLRNWECITYEGECSQTEKVLSGGTNVIRWHKKHGGGGGGKIELSFIVTVIVLAEYPIDQFSWSCRSTVVLQFPLNLLLRLGFYHNCSF